MKKKTNIRTLIRNIVREEVAVAIQEVITELKQPTQQVSQPKAKKKIVEKINYSNNSVLNDVLNETAMDDEWKTINLTGNGKFDSSKMNEVMSSQYGDLMNNDTNPNVAVDGQTADFLNKDYREVLKKSEEKSKQRRGV